VLSQVERKNCWWLAEHAGLAGPASMQRLWRDAVRDDVSALVVEYLGQEAGVLIVGAPTRSPPTCRAARGSATAPGPAVTTGPVRLDGFGGAPAQVTVPTIDQVVQAPAR
jgi:hypothetical protein